MSKFGFLHYSTFLQTPSQPLGKIESQAPALTTPIHGPTDSESNRRPHLELVTVSDPNVKTAKWISANALLAFYLQIIPLPGEGKPSTLSLVCNINSGAPYHDHPFYLTYCCCLLQPVVNDGSISFITILMYCTIRFIADLTCYRCGMSSPRQEMVWYESIYI